MKNKKGLVLVYTGKGKGKTTAALGLALRAIGHGAHVFMVQFKKGDPHYGEIQAIHKYLPHFTVFQAGKNKMQLGMLKEDDPAIIQEGFQRGKEALCSGQYDLCIFDEINVVIDYRILPVSDVLEMLAGRPAHVDVVLTGRNAPVEIIEAADLVSEVKEIKHHLKNGIKARLGMEY
ncbi:MAG TPA: cob(I)yrinic acid a,c-diamide adenosyltransferase [Firmicutes bacterium]|nr:cob(I)yrinic acid a,c-diamide adenosyltransferase [Bacillota bacterium]